MDIQHVSIRNWVSNCRSTVSPDIFLIRGGLWAPSSKHLVIWPSRHTDVKQSAPPQVAFHLLLSPKEHTHMSNSEFLSKCWAVVCLSTARSLESSQQVTLVSSLYHSLVETPGTQKNVSDREKTQWARFLTALLALSALSSTFVSLCSKMTLTVAKWPQWTSAATNSNKGQSKAQDPSARCFFTEQFHRALINGLDIYSFVCLHRLCVYCKEIQTDFLHF